MENIINFCVVLFDQFYNMLCIIRFGVCKFNVVVIVEEFCVWVGSSSCVEGDWNEGFVNGVIEWVVGVMVVVIFFECFVDYILVFVFVFLVGYEVCDVGVYNRNYGLIVVVIVDYLISCQ